MKHWFELDATIRRHVSAGEPAALKLFAETFLFKPNRIEWVYTADSHKWFARPVKRFVSVPPPVDLIALAILGHEVGHVLVGPCPNRGAHQDNPRGRSSSCLECERLAWLACLPLLPPFDRAMHDRLVRALGSYRRLTPAPASTQRQADEVMGTVSYAKRRMTAQRWEEKLARQAAANASLAKDRARFHRLDELQERIDRLRRS